MGMDEEIQAEITKLEAEIAYIDKELEKMHEKILQILALRKKKDKMLKALRPDTGIEQKDVQTTLSRVIKEMRDVK